MAVTSTRKRKGTATLIATRPQLLVDGSDEMFRHLIQDVLALSERWNTVRAGFGEYIGLSGIQYTILVSVAHMQRDENVSVKRVAEHLHLSGTFVTTVTGQLEKLKLIRKKRDNTDRRKVRIVVTTKGKSLLRQLDEIQQRINDEMFSCLSAHEFRSLTKMADEMIVCADRAISLQRHLSLR